MDADQSLAVAWFRQIDLDHAHVAESGELLQP
jgi:hypothetical protein